MDKKICANCGAAMPAESKFCTECGTPFPAVEKKEEPPKVPEPQPEVKPEVKPEPEPQPAPTPTPAQTAAPTPIPTPIPNQGPTPVQNQNPNPAQPQPQGQPYRPGPTPQGQPYQPAQPVNPAQAAQIIGALPPDRQADVAKRIAMMDRTSPDVIKEVERVLESKISSLVNQDYTIIGGVDSVVEILNTVDRGTEKHIMETLEVDEPELADEIRKKMFVFEDILLLDDRAIQRVLRDVDNSDLSMALKGANEQVQAAIFKNMSSRLSAMIKEDMEFMGPVRMKDVEEAQQKIVNIIRKLEDSAEIVISRGGGDEIIV